MKRIINDREKLEEFLGIFPEEDMNYFFDVLHNGFFRGQQELSIINPFENYSRIELQKFFNKDCEKLRKVFLEDFWELVLFLRYNFYPKNTIDDLENHILELCPEQRSTDIDLWNKKNNELIKHLYKAHDSYKSFISGANKIISKKNEKVKTLNIESVVIDFELGIYREVDYKNTYPISGKRLKILKILSENKNLKAQSIINTLDYNSVQLLSQEIKKINDTFRKKLNVKHNIIEHSKTGGYFLNKNDLKIITK